MKKLLFVFAVAGLFTLVSCAGNKEEAKTETTDTTKTEVIADTTTKVAADTTVKAEAAAPVKEVKKVEKKK